MRILSVGLLSVAAVVLVLTAAPNAADPAGKSYRFRLDAAGSVEPLAERSMDITTVLNTPELLLPNNIGKLIDQARLSGDPNDSWPLVALLLSAEQKAGKSSALVSARQLLEEVTGKARAAKDPLSLYSAAIAYQALGDLAQYQTLLGEYNDLLTSPPPTKAGPSSYDFVVYNWRSESVDVYLNGDYLGVVPPGYNIYWSDRWPVYESKDLFISSAYYYWEASFYVEPYDVIRYDVY